MKYIKSWKLFESEDSLSREELDRLRDLGLVPDEEDPAKKRMLDRIINHESPEPKDHLRARNLKVSRGKTSPDGLPFESEAEKMAKLITDKQKLVRRAKAVWREYRGPGFGPFYRALRRFGFSDEQINRIKTSTY